MSTEAIVERLGYILRVEDSNKFIGENINGPALLKVSKYHRKIINYKFLLFFSHHEGDFIRLMGSNSPIGPWIILPIQILKNNINIDFHDHIASPDVHGNLIKDKIIIFFHSREIGSRKQLTFKSELKNIFDSEPKVEKTNLPFYARIFKYKKVFYALTKGGNLFETNDPLFLNWVPLVNIFTGETALDDVYQNSEGSIRHVCVIKYKRQLFVFYTLIGDKPEQIWVSKLIINRENRKYEVIGKTSVLRPVKLYEGWGIVLRKSKSGPALMPENAVRDPFVIKHRNKYLMYYAIQGEFGLAVASLDIKKIKKKLGDKKN